MENDFLKSTWQRMPIEEKSGPELRNILKARSDSLMKKIRRQLIIEIIGVAVFLFVYYDFFDGDKKPVNANVFLVTALLFMIGQSVLGLLKIQNGVKGENIGQLLSGRLHKMKRHAVASGILRLIAVCSFLVFFISVIKFTQVKYWILSGALLIFLLQILAFTKIWKIRIRHMKDLIESLRNE